MEKRRKEAKPDPKSEENDNEITKNAKKEGKENNDKVDLEEGPQIINEVLNERPESDKPNLLKNLLTCIQCNRLIADFRLHEGSDLGEESTKGSQKEEQDKAMEEALGNAYSNQITLKCCLACLKENNLKFICCVSCSDRS